MASTEEQDIQYVNRREAERRALLLLYATDRLAALGRRSPIYVIGWAILVGHTSFLLGTIATSVILLGEMLDCFVLHRAKVQLKDGGPIDVARKQLNLSGGAQALSLALGVVIYVLNYGADSSILGISAVLAMGVVNAALILPTNPGLAIFKILVFVTTPLLMEVYVVVAFTPPGTPISLGSLDYPTLMVLFSMAFMSFCFAKAGLESFKRSEELKRSQLNLSVANKTLQNQKNELQKLSMLARKTNDAVLLMDADQNIEWVNEAFSDLSGVPQKWVVGRTFKDLLALSDSPFDIDSFVRETVRRGEAHRTEMLHHGPDGAARWADMHLVPIKDEEGTIDFFVLIVREITALKEHNERMRTAQLAAEDAAKTKADFLANMSHEIRTPLTGIIGMADLLSQTQQSTDQRDYTQTILGSSRSLLTILNDILDLSKIEAGKLEISETTFDPKACFGETIDLMRPATSQKGLDLSLKFANDVPDRLVADDVRVRQILTNIIGNATKFTEEGQIDVCVWVTQDHTDAGLTQTMLHFSVKDTGIGIAQDKLAAIFDEFTQAESSTTRRFGGTGLGLTICKVLTTIMGGDIRVESAVGTGSSFFVSLPVELGQADADQAESTHLQAEVPEDPLDLVGLRVLVAEDNRTNRVLIQKFLESLPIELSFVPDGYQAIEATIATQPDIIFMDMSMPNMGGVEATENIREQDIPQPAIIALTANAFESERQTCLTAGMDDFLTKPVRREVLVANLRKHAAQRNSQTSSVQAALKA